MEIWKKIDGYENYSVSSEGRVRNDKTGRILKACKDKKGYLGVLFYKNGKNKRFYVHRLVCIAFIPNPLGLPCVDHINTLKHDNRMDNLRWCSHHENNCNPITRKRNSEAKTGRQLSEETKIKISKARTNKKSVICTTTGKTYESAHEAERQTGVAQQSISACCRGKLKSAGKDENGNRLEWKFLDEYLESLK